MVFFSLVCGLGLGVKDSNNSGLARKDMGCKNEQFGFLLVGLAAESSAECGRSTDVQSPFGRSVQGLGSWGFGTGV